MPTQFYTQLLNLDTIILNDSHIFIKDSKMYITFIINCILINSHPDKHNFIISEGIFQLELKGLLRPADYFFPYNNHYLAYSVKPYPHPDRGFLP